MIESIILINNLETILPENLPTYILKNEKDKLIFNDHTLPLKDVLADVEKKYINRILVEENWNKNKTSRILGMTRVTLDKKIAKYCMNKQNSLRYV